MHVKSAMRSFPVKTTRGEKDKEMQEISEDPSPMEPWEAALKSTVDNDQMLPMYEGFQHYPDCALLDFLVEYYEKCPNDTDGDGDCQHCAHLPGKCPN